MSPTFRIAEAVILLWVAVAATCGQGQPSSDRGELSSAVREEFLAWCKNQLPERGSVVVTYAAKAGASQRTVGLDAHTRSWFYASDRSCGGRTPLGRVFRGGLAGVDYVDDVAYGATPLGIAEYIPAAFLYHFIERPEDLYAVTKRPEGGWTVSYVQAGPEDRPLAMVEFDQDGGAVRFWLDDPEDTRERTFVYDPQALGVFAVVRVVGARSDKMVREVQHSVGGDDANLFEMNRVESTLRNNSVVAEIARNAYRLGYTQDQAGEWVRTGPDGSVPYDDRMARAWRWSLFGVGLVFVVLAGVEIWRRRR